MSEDGAAAPPRELEIKLTGPREVLERALRSPIVKSVQLGHPRTRKLESVYFDTPDARLQKLGVGLRLRKQGRKWIQTLKRERGVTSGLHDRDEFEHSVGLRWPSYALYDQTVFAPLFADLELRNLIQPLFTTRFRRIARTLGDDDARIELAYDLGEVEADGERAPLCELELELKAGEVDALFALATGLCREFGLRLENRSKAERGYTLMAKETPAPGRARAVALAPSLPCADAFARIASECLRHLQANEAGVMAGEDPEYVHQARVALRRLRAAIALFRRAVGCAQLEDLDGEMQRLSQALGVARDWDVFCLETLPGLPKELDVGAGRAALAALATAHRQQAARFVHDIVSQPEFTLALLRFGTLLQVRPWNRASPVEGSTPVYLDVRDHARLALSRAWRRAVKRARTIDTEIPDSYHPLRIALKKLRYGGEYFASLFPRKATRPFLTSLAGIQEHLGRVNDAATAQRLAATLREQCHDADAREMLGVLRGYFSGRMAGAVKPVMREWKKLRQIEPFWT